MKTRPTKLAALAVAVCLTAGLAYGRVYERIQALFADGTVALPGMSFVSDPNTGAYRAAADTYSVSTGGAESARFSDGTLALKGDETTNSITSATTAATATSAIAALTFAPTATLQANDLVCEVNSAAGATLFSVDLEGDSFTTGDFNFTGANINSLATTTAILTSDTAAGTMTNAIPAFRLLASATPDAEDMLFEVMYGATSVFSVDKEGDLTMAGSATFAPADVSLSGNDLTGAKTDQSFNIVSDTADGTTSTSVAALTLAPSATLTAGDLVVEVNSKSTAGTSILTCDMEGDVYALGDLTLAGNGVNCSGAAATCLLTSSANDDATSGTVGAITLKAGADITAADLALDVQDNAGGHIFKCTEAGACTALTSLAATTTLSVGTGTAIAKITSQQVDDQDVGSAAAATTVTLAVNVTGATLGDSVICQSVQDDAAWDECTLSCFVESAGVVKLVVHADASGCDPAATNDYRFTLMRF